MSDRPNHSDSINLVGHVLCVYEKKSPFLRSRVLVPKSLNPVDHAGDSCLKSGTQLVILILHGCFRYHELKYNLGKKTPSRFLYADLTYARLFVYRNQVAIHK